MAGSAEQGHRFLEESRKRLATLTTKEGKLDFEGYKIAEVADEMLKDREDYIASIAVGSGVRAYAGTGDDRHLNIYPDRDVVVVIKGQEPLPEQRLALGNLLSRKIKAQAHITSNVDCTPAYFDGAGTVKKTIESLRGMASQDDFWLLIFSPAAFGENVDQCKEVVRNVLKDFPEKRQGAIIRGFARLIVEGEKKAYHKSPNRFPELQQAQLEELFLKRRENWAEQIAQALRLKATLA
jgi:hypothetical protein